MHTQASKETYFMTKETYFMTKETYLYSKKRPADMIANPWECCQEKRKKKKKKKKKKTYYGTKQAYRGHAVKRATNPHGKRALFLWPKSPIPMAKEPYSYGKRALFLRHTVGMLDRMPRPKRW